MIISVDSYQYFGGNEAKQAWDDWLQSPSLHAQHYVAMMEAGVGKYFNIIQMVAQKV